MKFVLLILFLFIYSFSFAQITFEQVISPNDFNIGSVRKSQIGEYFLQPVNDDHNIYSSLDGVNWLKSSLPKEMDLDDIQFFSDGTPLLENIGYSLIRRNWTWLAPEIPGSQGTYQSSFIKEDTLFTYIDQVFYYSLDKGQNFFTLFVATEPIPNYSIHLFKINDYIFLYTWGGGDHQISVFTQQGTRVLYEHLSLHQAGYNTISFTINCDQLLINNDHDYYLFTGLQLQHGTSSSIFPVFHNFSTLITQNNKWYLREGNTIYRTAGCNFTWDTLATGDFVASKDNFWVSPLGDIFLNTTYGDKFYEQANGSDQWEEKRPDITFPYITDFDESTQNKQFELTSNFLFHKNSNDPTWIKVDSIRNQNYEALYAPSGDLYINRKTDILYSKDNGVSFIILPLPSGQFPPNDFTLHVLDDGVLFVNNFNHTDTYYSLNNGQDWIPTGFPLITYRPQVRKIDHYIIIADLYDIYSVTTINVVTGETTYNELGDFVGAHEYSGVILDDGTIYFDAFDYSGTYPDGLFRYRISTGLEYLGDFDLSSTSAAIMVSLGNDLYVFTATNYYAFNGQNFESFNYVGLPDLFPATLFTISTNKYVFVFDRNHTIYRSTEPLSYPQYISGTVFNDEIPVCVEDTLDPGLQYWKVTVEGQNYLRIKNTNAEGKFKFYVPAGEYTISSQPLNSNWDLCEDTYHVSIDTNQTTAKQDFLATGVSSCAGLDLDFSTPFLRRCFDNTYYITVRNTGPGASAGTEVTLHLDPFFEFVSASIPYTLVGDSIVKFDLGVMELNDQVSFQMYIKVSCDAVLGQEHCMTGILNDDNSCGNDRSSYTECQENIGSNDPNDKRIFNAAGEETDLIEKGEYIYYHIRFQNTGTDTAFRVRILDPLSEKLDFSTLEILSASQPYDYVITDGPALSVTFDHILLPDSSINEAASHGFIKFKVKPLAQYDYGTNIPNQASIYFDFNQPVITNEAIMMIQHVVGTTEAKELLQFDLFPNPTKDEIFITASESDLNQIDTYEIIDPLGQIVLQSTYMNGKPIKVDRLAPGVYYLCVKEKENVIGMKKFIRL